MAKKDSKGASKVKIRPLQDRVLIKRVDEQEQVRGGIIIPDTAKEKPQEAEVVAVGPGKINDDGTRLPMDVKVGEKILVGKYSGSDIKIDGEDYVIVREDEILAVVG
jgi:chaperonin GroES